jgi:hypothetical protein
LATDGLTRLTPKPSARPSFGLGPWRAATSKPETTTRNRSP